MKEGNKALDELIRFHFLLDSDSESELPKESNSEYGSGDGIITLLLPLFLDPDSEQNCHQLRKELKSDSGSGSGSVDIEGFWR